MIGLLTNEAQKAIDAATRQFVAQVTEIAEQNMAEQFRSIMRGGSVPGQPQSGQGAEE